MKSTKSLKDIINASNMDSDMTEKQINILSAAIELFSEKGYEATATSEIAKKAQVAEGTIFRYYKTKKELLFAIPKALSKVSLFEIFLEDFNEILNDEHDNFEDFLRKIIMNRKKFVSETAPILKVIIQEVPFHPELRSKILNTVIFPSTENGISIIEKFKLKNQIVDMPSTTIINLIITSIFGYLFVHYIALPELPENEQDLEYLIQYILNGIGQNSTLKNTPR
ncbi:TetR family transcriptional regulator [Clostridium gelidum]|uniref:TetR family transcriptional regulator n=1 Tax=Clostridium gelidum TaxID=704125 RepID=A0ABN6ITG5_9CLOT|nr:TetR/AcrR family transcriptional regulator [Clostridium gelidum]BCZ44863.1 TetR family transcriptional regulator [Clostridium gelidum]